MRSYLLIVGFYLISCGNTKTQIKHPGYELVKDWPALPNGFSLGQVTGVDIDTNQNIILFHRAGRKWTVLNEIFPDTPIAGNTILVLENESGKPLKSWGAGLFIMPHGLTVDKENNVWVTDVGLQQVLKFNHDGKLIMKVGTARVTGNDPLHFNYPTDIAVCPNGSFYVSDGYRNSRVVKFSREGRYLFEWGSKGTSAGEFNTPHGIDLDSQGNVYIADRENNRIQKFDSSGKFITQWRNDRATQLYSLAVNPKTDNITAVDYLVINGVLIKGSDILSFDSNVNLSARFGRTGFYNGPTCRYHDITIDSEGSIFVSDILENRIQKFKNVNNKTSGTGGNAKSK